MSDSLRYKKMFPFVYTRELYAARSYSGNVCRGYMEW
jgi:hypothetical protein